MHLFRAGLGVYTRMVTDTVHGFVYIEFRCSRSELEPALKFYKDLFNWRVDILVKGETPYIAFDVDEGVAGGFTVPSLDQKAAWIPYVKVVDVLKSVAEAKELGALIVKEASVIPNKGALAIVADPMGALPGLWQPYAPLNPV